MFTEMCPILSTPATCPGSPGFHQEMLGFTETYRFPADSPPQYVGLRRGVGLRVPSLESPHVKIISWGR